MALGRVLPQHGPPPALPVFERLTIEPAQPAMPPAQQEGPGDTAKDIAPLLKPFDEIKLEQRDKPKTRDQTLCRFVLKAMQDEFGTDKKTGFQVQLQMMVNTILAVVEAPPNARACTAALSSDAAAS